ncbi:transmembrane protein [Mycobacterium numidiamassiliense]|uniref:Transmembrane protein n=1 Tax=Mycobacterium numidiamassiliense TaxID=1841861 RepID=A0A2U3PFC2_9MYCO|nr:hypothetical protein [Mycobacterium numidiamassiliense]SPM42385.1 transmembrane protein [Mycobacterium numidiamassiliense]
METFTLDPRCWRIGVILSPNPLIRRVGRVEALVTLVALGVALLAIPVAVVVGAAIYGIHAHLYAQEARERHAVMATVTDSWSDGLGSIVVQVKWPVAAGERTGRLEVANAAREGDRAQMWVDKEGNQAGTAISEVASTGRRTCHNYVGVADRRCWTDISGRRRELAA